MFYACEVCRFLSSSTFYYYTYISIFSLPFPWLLSALIFGPVKVSSSGMACSIVILFLMLLFVIISIAIFKWKMNIGLALVMFVLYFAFVAMSLLLEYRIIDCEVIMAYVGVQWWSYSRWLFRRTWLVFFIAKLLKVILRFAREHKSLNEVYIHLVQANFFPSRKKGTEFVFNKPVW